MEIKKQSLVHEVMQQLISNINKGIYSPGDKLPSTEDLAKIYGVGRSSIREALLELQGLGVVSLRHGEGTYICSYSDPNQGPLKNVAEVRRMIEIYCVMSTASNFHQKNLQKLKECVDQMEQNLCDSNTFMYYDRCFHFIITEAKDNPLITSFLKSVEILFKQIQISVVDFPGQKERALQEHKLIYKALQMQNTELAIQSVNTHHDNILNLWLMAFKK